MPQQLRDPLAVAHVGLLAGDRLDVAGVDQQQPPAGVLQHVVQWPPVDASGLHRDLLDALLGQPRAQRQEVASHGAEAPDLFTWRPGCLRDQHAGHDQLLVDVQPGTPLIDHVHVDPPSPWMAEPDALLAQTLGYVLPCSGATLGGASGHPGPTYVRALSTRERPTFNARAIRPQHTARPHFIPPVAATRPWTT
jgi:hypothetical protein